MIAVAAMPPRDAKPADSPIAGGILCVTRVRTSLASAIAEQDQHSSG